ncbi:MAG: hypothetical protein H2035_04340 [Acidimicrobiales bacterium]|mgnify:FL=1|nr:hypothetical protein [Acidimicrobiales bacterium]
MAVISNSRISIWVKIQMNVAPNKTKEMNQTKECFALQSLVLTIRLGGVVAYR